MFSKTLISVLPFIALVHGHGAIIKVVGAGGPEGRGFLVDPDLPRNCTTISPCQLDATLIRDAEIAQNIVNGCGRTELAGNIDIGEQTENELKANRVTQVRKGSVVKVTIHQVNADGAGPYTCDLDESSNASEFSAPLKVTNNVPGVNGLSQAKFQDFTMDVELPANMNCFGASTGDICTVRCRNNAVAGPFGGCFAVQQTDGSGRKNTTAAAVTTKQTLNDILSQVEVNKQDLGAALQANQNAGANGKADAVSVAEIEGLASGASGAAASAPAANNGKNNGNKGQGNNGGNAKANGGNAKANGGNAKANGNANANGKNNNKRRMLFFSA